MDMGKGAPALRPAAGAARLKSEGEHMVNYLIKRTLFALLLVLVVATIVFGIVRLAPGDPAIVILGDAASQESIEALHEEMGLNQPLWRQYAVFMGNLAQLDLGDSMINGVPVLDQLEVALPYTLELTTAGMILGVVLGIPLGVICAHPGLPGACALAWRHFHPFVLLEHPPFVRIRCEMPMVPGG